jgi:hypothetical protein
MVCLKFAFSGCSTKLMMSSQSMRGADGIADANSLTVLGFTGNVMIVEGQLTTA